MMMMRMMTNVMMNMMMNVMSSDEFDENDVEYNDIENQDDQ